MVVDGGIAKGVVVSNYSPCQREVWCADEKVAGRLGIRTKTLSNLLPMGLRCDRIAHNAPTWRSWHFHFRKLRPEVPPTHDEIDLEYYPSDNDNSLNPSLSTSQSSNKPSKWVPHEVSEPARAMRSAVISARRCAKRIGKPPPKQENNQTDYCVSATRV